MFAFSQLHSFQGRAPLLWTARTTIGLPRPGQPAQIRVGVEPGTEQSHARMGAREVLMRPIVTAAASPKSLKRAGPSPVWATHGW